MVLPNTMQGRVFGPLQLAEIRGLLQAHPDWSRYQLSRQLARQWDWYGSSGQLKDMASRTLLNKLSQRGWIELPPLRMASPTRSGRRPPPVPEALNLDQSLWVGQLSDLQPLRIQEISHSKDRTARARLENCLHQYHYLRYQSRGGENLQYWVGKYRHSIELLETFVDRSRFRGTCYRAANWLQVGQTQGRGRQGPNGVLSTPIKDVYLHALHRHCKQRLCTEIQPLPTPPRGGAELGKTGPMVGGPAAELAANP